MNSKENKQKSGAEKQKQRGVEITVEKSQGKQQAPAAPATGAPSVLIFGRVVTCASPDESAHGCLHTLCLSTAKLKVRLGTTNVLPFHSDRCASIGEARVEFRIPGTHQGVGELKPCLPSLPAPAPSHKVRGSGRIDVDLVVWSLPGRLNPDPESQVPRAWHGSSHTWGRGPVGSLKAALSRYP